jgi:hypothetical protein
MIGPAFLFPLPWVHGRGNKNAADGVSFVRGVFFFSH